MNYLCSNFFLISLILANKHCYRIIVINNIYVVCDTFCSKGNLDIVNFGKFPPYILDFSITFCYLYV